MSDLLRYKLMDEDGNTFEGVEVLRLSLKEEGKDEETEILLLEDNEGTWFPFILMGDGESLAPVDDEEILTAIEDTLGLIIETEETPEG